MHRVELICSWGGRWFPRARFTSCSNGSRRLLRNILSTFRAAGSNRCVRFQETVQSETKLRKITLGALISLRRCVYLFYLTLRESFGASSNP